jgi:hypothetical protein
VVELLSLLEHDHDTPGDGPLLETDQTTTLSWGSLDRSAMVR